MPKIYGTATIGLVRAHAAILDAKRANRDTSTISSIDHQKSYGDIRRGTKSKTNSETQKKKRKEQKKSRKRNR